MFESFVAMSRLDDLDPYMARQMLRGAVGTAGVVEDLIAPLDGLDLRSLARRVGCTGAGLLGREGPARRVERASRWRRRWVREIVAIPDVGHMPMLEAQYALTAAFRRISRLSLAA